MEPTASTSRESPHVSTSIREAHEPLSDPSVVPSLVPSKRVHGDQTNSSPAPRVSVDRDLNDKQAVAGVDSFNSATSQPQFIQSSSPRPPSEPPIRALTEDQATENLMRRSPKRAKFNFQALSSLEDQSANDLTDTTALNEHSEPTIYPSVEPESANTLVESELLQPLVQHDVAGPSQGTTRLRVPRSEHTSQSGVDGLSTIDNANATPPRDDVEALQNDQERRQATREKRSARRRRALQDAAAAIVDDAVNASSSGKRKKDRRSRRQPTPEEIRDQEIAPSETRMAELCSDNKTGKISSREQEFRKMDRAALAEKSAMELRELMGQSDPQEPHSDQPNATGDTQPNSLRPPGEDVVRDVPRTFIRDGQIVVDTDSLQIDRHAAADAQRLVDELPPIEENDLSRKVTSGKWIKRDKSGGWNEQLLDRFYEGLRMFGTDFEIISRMFPGKSRHAIKLKFCKEERLDDSRIRAALLGERLPVMLEDYENMTGSKYKDPAEIEQLLEEDRRRLDEEQALEKQAMEEAAQERVAQADAERAAASEEPGREGSDAKKRKGKGKRKARRNKEKEASAASTKKPQPKRKSPSAAASVSK